MPYRGFQSKMSRNRLYGFTLAELLIALAILGLIATFSIPKILTTQQNSKYNTIAKEAAATISEAYKLYKKENQAGPNTSADDIAPYMNYVTKGNATGTIDARYGGTNTSCSTSRCLILHNGAALKYSNEIFCGTTNNVLYFYVDPDGKETDGTTNSPGKSVVFFLYYNGRITTYETLEPNSQAGTGCSQNYQPTSDADPPWFSW